MTFKVPEAFVRETDPEASRLLSLQGNVPEFNIEAAHFIHKCGNVGSTYSPDLDIIYLF